MNEAKHYIQDSYCEISEKTPMSKTKRNVASTVMGIPTLGLAAAAFLYITKPDAESTMIDSDEESSYIDEWSSHEQVNADCTNEAETEFSYVCTDPSKGAAAGNLSTSRALNVTDNTDSEEDSTSAECDRHRLLK